MNNDAVNRDGEQAARTERSVARDAGAGLVLQQTVVLLVDLVESVRLMEKSEAFTVRRWADFVRIVTSEILPRHHGVLVKSHGRRLVGAFRDRVRRRQCRSRDAPDGC